VARSRHAPDRSAILDLMKRTRRSYFLCATPRSGSSLLCELLASTKVAAWPAEYFWRGDEAFWRERWGISDGDDFIAAALNAGTASYGVFGAKVMWDHLDNLATKARIASGNAADPLPELLARLFPNLRYVWVTRRDRLRQAISLARALETDVWARRPGDAVAPAVDATVDVARIERLRNDLEQQDRGWLAYFESAGVRPITVVYEELAADPRGATLALLRDLGLSLPRRRSVPEPVIRPQADEITDEWVERFVRATGDGRDGTSG
jgi:LPS sulfotransferase NodH